MVFSGYVCSALFLQHWSATSLAFFLQSKMQQFTSASHTAIIFAAEPVFSAVFAYLLAGELLSPRGYIGAALVLSGILIAEFTTSGKVGQWDKGTVLLSHPKPFNLFQRI
jgi:drug/metabolite transporter (DMT)-like permease